ncbi:MAG: CopD family protein [Pseudomonadota bacterium]
MAIYLWLKAIHIIFVVAWMAGMLIYPRYKLHQLSSQPGEPLFDTMADASARLRRIILTPSMLIVWILGIGLIAHNTALLSTGWLWLKIVLVLALSGIHGFFISLGRKIDQGDASVSTARLKMLNELPFVLMILIVILVVVRPF